MSKKHLALYEFGNRVRMCDERLDDFENIVEDMGEVTCKRCAAKYDSIFKDLKSSQFKGNKTSEDKE